MQGGWVTMKIGKKSVFFLFVVTVQTFIVYTDQACNVQKIKEIGASGVCEQAAQMLMSCTATVLLLQDLASMDRCFQKAISLEILNTHA